jgi:hypothetical protein
LDLLDSRLEIARELGHLRSAKEDARTMVGR